MLTLPGFRDTDFGKSYGTGIEDGALAGLYARSTGSGKSRNICREIPAEMESG